MKKMLIVIACSSFLISCAPEVGSEKWCQQMKEKDKGDWTASEAKDFAKHCIF